METDDRSEISLSKIGCEGKGDEDTRSTCALLRTRDPVQSLIRNLDELRLLFPITK